MTVSTILYKINLAAVSICFFVVFFYINLTLILRRILQVLAAEGEQRASRALKEAADIMSQSPAAIQLRYLQTLNSIAAERNSTIIFPLPMDLLRGLAGK